MALIRFLQCRISSEECNFKLTALQSHENAENLEKNGLKFLIANKAVVHRRLRRRHPFHKGLV